MFEVGRVCLKIAGRDAGKHCVVLDVKDNMVLVGGGVRRRMCNVKHLEPLNNVLKVKKGASASEVKTLFEKEGYFVWETKPKKASERPRKSKVVKSAPVEEKTSKKKEPKKTKKEVVKEPVKKEEKKEVKKAPAKKESKGVKDEAK